jgi:hypothetical protein
MNLSNYFVKFLKNNEELMEYFDDYIQSDNERLHNKILIEYTFVQLVLNDIINNLDISFTNQKIYNNELFNLNELTKYTDEEDKVNIINIFNNTLKEIFITDVLRQNYLLYDNLIPVKQLYDILNYILTKLDTFNIITQFDEIKLYEKISSDIDNYYKIKNIREFINLINACNWSSFLLDWRLFTYFKKNFYVIYELAKTVLIIILFSRFILSI